MKRAGAPRATSQEVGTLVRLLAADLDRPVAAARRARERLDEIRAGRRQHREALQLAAVVPVDRALAHADEITERGAPLRRGQFDEHIVDVLQFLGIPFGHDGQVVVRQQRAHGDVTGELALHAHPQVLVDRQFAAVARGHVHGLAAAHGEIAEAGAERFRGGRVVGRRRIAAGHGRAPDRVQVQAWRQGDWRVVVDGHDQDRGAAGLGPGAQGDDHALARAQTVVDALLPGLPRDQQAEARLIHVAMRQGERSRAAGHLEELVLLRDRLCLRRRPCCQQQHADADHEAPYS